MIKIGQVEALENTASCKLARGRHTNADAVPRRSELGFGICGCLVVSQQRHLEVGSDPAHESNRTEPIYLEGWQNVVPHLYTSLQNACKGIASHSHQEMTAEFIPGKIQAFTLEAKTSLHNFPTLQKGKSLAFKSINSLHTFYCTSTMPQALC